MENTVKLCAGCQKELPHRQSLICSLCKSAYDLECANVSTTRFYGTMTSEHKQNWKCPACYCKQRKVGNVDSPIRPSGCLNQQQTSPTNINVTLRKKMAQRGNSLSSDDLSISGDTICFDSKPVSTEACEAGKEELLTLQNLNNLIILRLRENNTSIINELKDTISTQINIAMTKLRNDITQETNTLSSENNQRKSEIQQVNSEIQKLRRESEALKKEIQEIHKLKNVAHSVPEINSKKFVIYGLKEYPDEPESNLHDRIISAFRDILRVDLLGYIEETYRMGRNTMSNRPLVIELISKRMVKYIVDNRTLFQRSSLSVSEFLDEKARKERRELREEMLAARKKGHFAIIRNHQLFINGTHINKKHKDCIEIYNKEQTEGNNLDRTHFHEPTPPAQAKQRGHSFRNSRPTI